MPKRDRRSMIFGFGLGVVITVAVLFIVYIIQRRVYVNEIADLQDRVGELEILVDFLEGEADVGFEIVMPTEPPTEAAAEPATEPLTELPTEAPTVAEATAEPPAAPVPDEDIPPTTPVVASPPAAAGYAWVSIPANITSSEITQILSQAGVVTDSQAFLNFLGTHGFNSGLMAGNFMLPLDANFDTIIDIILAASHRD